MERGYAAPRWASGARGCNGYPAARKYCNLPIRVDRVDVREFGPRRFQVGRRLIAFRFRQRFGPLPEITIGIAGKWRADLVLVGLLLVEETARG